MEPTGMSWFPIAVWLARARAEAVRVKGKRVKALRRYLSEHAKTDNSDAHTLGAMPSYGGPAPVDRRWPVSSGRMHRAITRTPGRSLTS